MAVLVVTHTDTPTGEVNVQEFLGKDVPEAIDTFIMWLDNESFDYRFPPRAMQSLLLTHAPNSLRMGGSDWDVLFEFSK